MATEVAGAAVQDEHPAMRPWTWQWCAVVIVDLAALAVIVVAAIELEIWVAL